MLLLLLLLLLLLFFFKKSVTTGQTNGRTGERKNFNSKIDMEMYSVIF